VEDPFRRNGHPLEGRVENVQRLDQPGHAYIEMPEENTVMVGEGNRVQPARLFIEA